jgi:hypothetical protein
MVSIQEQASKNVSKQHKVAAQDKHQKSADQKKAFLPWHALHVPKETDFRGMTQQPFVDGTTLMLRNIPNKYTQTQLLQEIEDLGFAGTYDFFYLPMDKQNRSNVGYAFINFMDPTSATKCWSVLTNYKFQHFQSKKICAVSPAHLQGFEKNFKHFSDRAVMNARKNEKYRPVVLRDVSQHAKTEAAKYEASMEAPNPFHILELDKALFSGSSGNHPSADVFEPCFVQESLREVAPKDHIHQFGTNFFEPCYVAAMPKAELHEMHMCKDFKPQKLPEPQLGLGPSTSLKGALSELLQQNGAARVGGDQQKSSSVQLPLQSEFYGKYPPPLEFDDLTVSQGSSRLLTPPGLCPSLHSSQSLTPLGLYASLDSSKPRTPPGLCPSSDSEEADEYVVPGKLVPPGLFPSDPEYVLPQGPCKLQQPIGPFFNAAAVYEGSFDPDDATPRTKHSYLADCFGPANTWTPPRYSQ